MPGKARLPEELTVAQDAYCGFLSALRHDGKPDLSFLDAENRPGNVALHKDCLPFVKNHDIPASIDGWENFPGIERAGFSGCRCGRHD